jgi:hypothetical protein
VTGLLPGSVGRTSRRLAATYRVRLTIDPSHRRVLARLWLGIRNRSGGPIDRLELRQAARVPLRVRSATIGGHELRTTAKPGRLTVWLGGVLAAGASVEVVLDLVVPLGERLGGDAWFHAHRSGIVQLSEWLPRTDPGFSRVIDARVRAPRGWRVGVGALTQAREVPVAASRAYRALQGTAAGVAVTVLYLPGDRGRAAARATLADARRALPWITRRLGPLPRDALTIAQVESTRFAYSWPGMIWLPDHLTPAEVRLYLSHELTHQWFGGITTTADPRRDPFAGEAPTELTSRLYLHGIRPSACPGRRLDRPKAWYGSCFYEAIYVDGANVLNRIRKRMGDGAYWRTLRRYLGDNRFRVTGTRDLLRALEAATAFDLSRLIARRFPSLAP